MQPNVVFNHLRQDLALQISLLLSLVQIRLEPTWASCTRLARNSLKGGKRKLENRRFFFQITYFMLLSTSWCGFCFPSVRGTFCGDTFNCKLRTL